jgi:hypothetical protein
MPKISSKKTMKNSKKTMKKRSIKKNLQRGGLFTMQQMYDTIDQHITDMLQNYERQKQRAEWERKFKIFNDILDKISSLNTEYEEEIKNNNNNTDMNEELKAMTNEELKTKKYIVTVIGDLIKNDQGKSNPYPSPSTQEVTGPATSTMSSLVYSFF